MTAEILRYRSRPRHKGEILCHNHIMHDEVTPHGMNGFRYFVAKRRRRCPCAWRPDLGPHYADPEHVEYQRKRIARGEPMEVSLPPRIRAAMKMMAAGAAATRKRKAKVTKSKRSSDAN